MKIFYGQATRPGRNSGESSVIRKRIFFDLILLAAVFYTPWWVVVVLGFIGAFYYPLYYEVIVAGLLIDILYGASSFPLGGVYGILGATVVFFLASYARKAVR